MFVVFITNKCCEFMLIPVVGRALFLATVNDRHDSASILAANIFTKVHGMKDFGQLA